MLSKRHSFAQCIIKKSQQHFFIHHQMNKNGSKRVAKQKYSQKCIRDWTITEKLHQKKFPHGSSQNSFLTFFV